MGETSEVIEKLITRLCDQESLIEISAEKALPDKEKRYLHPKAFMRLQELVIGQVEIYLEKNPFLAAMPRVELRSQSQRLTDAATFKAALSALIRKNRLVEKDKKIALTDYKMAISAKEMELAERIESEFKRAGYKTPLVREVQERLGIPDKSFQNVLSFLYEQGRLVRLDEKVTYPRATLDKAKDFVVEYIRKNQSISMADLRDAMGFSRKYAQPILEYLDGIGITKRVGDRRVLTP